VWNEYGHFTRDRRPVHNDVALNQCHRGFQLLFLTLYYAKGNPLSSHDSNSHQDEEPSFDWSVWATAKGDLLRRWSTSGRSPLVQQCRHHLEEHKMLFVCTNKASHNMRFKLRRFINNHVKSKHLSLQLSFPPQILLIRFLHTYNLSDLW